VIDTDSNEVAYLNFLEFEITAIDSVILQNSEINVIVGTEPGFIFLIKNWDDFPVKLTETFSSRINDIKFSHDETLIIVCSGNSVSLLFLEDSDEYVVSKRFELSDAEPLSIGLNEKYNYMMIITNTMKLFEINLKDYSIYDLFSKTNTMEKNKHNKDTEIENILSSISNTNWQSFCLKAPINPKSKNIITNISTFGNNIPIIISSFEGNIFHIWKDFYSVDEIPVSFSEYMLLMFKL